MTKNKGYKGISNGFFSNLMFKSKLKEKVVSSQLIEFKISYLISSPWVINLSIIMSLTKFHCLR